MQVLVVSEWANLRLRLHLRRALGACAARLGPEHAVELFFLMGDPARTVADESGAGHEMEVFQDLVLLGGPDKEDPSPAGHAAFLKVLDRPSVRAQRIVRGLAWLLEHRPDFDYVAQMPDSSFVHVPRLLGLIAEHANESLALGSIRETSLNVGGEDTAAHCETCPSGGDWERLCLQRTRAVPGGLDFRSCMVAAERCCPEGPDRCENLEPCIREAHEGGVNAALYYGTARAPRWLLGQGWVLGRRVAGFIGENAEDLRLRGMPDMLLGFWLAGLEDVHFVDLPAKLFLELPDAGQGSAECPAALVFAYPMDLERWAEWYDEEHCELRCSAADTDAASTAA